MQEEISPNANGHDCFHIHKAVVSAFAPFIDRRIPFIYISDYAPIETVVWTKMSLPINAKLDSAQAKYRRLFYDLLMETDEFLRNIEKFDKNGIFLLQMRKPMPDNLTLQRLEERVLDKVLIQNEVTLKIYLPHAVETGCITSFQKGYLSKIVEATSQ